MLLSPNAAWNQPADEDQYLVGQVSWTVPADSFETDDMFATGNRETHALSATIDDPCQHEDWTTTDLKLSVRR